MEAAGCFEMSRNQTTRHHITEDHDNERNIYWCNDNHMKVGKQQIPETVHILNISLTADINKHDNDDDEALK
jgi:hypothetical protein